MAARGTNPYINHTSLVNEQSLVESLIIESIQIHGTMMYYVPRELVSDDKLFGEDPISAFQEHYPIEIYCDTPTGFEGDGDFVSKFGIEIRDIATFTVSKKRFQEETGRVRPREGDLIYFPVSKSLMEIKFVEHEKPFFQLGKNYTFALNCEMFEFSEEEFTTGSTEIDTLINQLEYKTYFTVSLTSQFSGAIFAPGDLVYQSATAGTPTAGSTGAFFGEVDSLTGNTGLTQMVALRNVVGIWKKTTGPSATYYMTKDDNTKYFKVLDISTSTDNRPDVNNKVIEDKADGGIVSFDESNPFGDA